MDQAGQVWYRLSDVSLTCVVVDCVLSDQVTTARLCRGIASIQRLGKMKNTMNIH